MQRLRPFWLLCCWLMAIDSRADILDQWTSRGPSHSDSAPQLYDVAWGNNVFVAVGAETYIESVWFGREIQISQNGVTWAEAPPTVGPLANISPLFGVTFGAGKFVAVGIFDPSFGSVSTNGSDWFPCGDAPPASSGVVYGNGLFVSVGGFGFGPPGQAAVSNDGFSWKIVGPIPTFAGPFFNGVTFGLDWFVAVGDAGSIFYSANSIDWFEASSGTDASLNRIIFGGGLYVAVGDHGKILFSRNATSWSEATSGTENTLHGIAFGDGSYVAVGDNGTILTSVDARTWKPRQSGTQNDLFGITYGDDSFVAVGARGTILQSGIKPFLVKFDSARTRPGGFETYLTCEKGRSFRIETSSNLVDWTELSVETRPDAGLLFFDATPPTRPQRYYRAVAP